MGAGRPWSDLVTNHVVRTVSKVLCLRSLRTSRCCWALPVAVAASRNHTRLQLLLQLACDVCSCGWYVELTQRGFLQELGRDCGHMAARNASKQLVCVQCGLLKTRDAYKTKQWQQLRAGYRLSRKCEDNADPCLGLAAPMHAPVVLRVSAFNIAAFNQNMCMSRGILVFPFVHVCVDLVASAPCVR